MSVTVLAVTLSMVLGLLLLCRHAREGTAEMCSARLNVRNLKACESGRAVAADVAPRHVGGQNLVA
jgi:hypothetical protein